MCESKSKAENIYLTLKKVNTHMIEIICIKRVIISKRENEPI